MEDLISDGGAEDLAAMEMTDDGMDYSQDIFEAEGAMGYIDFEGFDPEDISLPFEIYESPETGDRLIGTPGAESSWNPQTTDFTCAVVAQQGVIQDFTGETISEAELVYEATANGWLTDAGTSPEDVGKLLELHGIPCHVNYNARIEDLMGELAQGHAFIASVDSGEMWGEDSFLEDFFEQNADHAIRVTNVRFDNNTGQYFIRINDSGDPTGAGREYPLAQFKDSWKDGGFMYVATDNAPPNLASQAVGFDAESGTFTELSSYIEKLEPGFMSRMESENLVEGETSPESIGGGMVDITSLENLGNEERNELFYNV